jgi:DNA-binding transcriptional MerR regulator
MKLDLTRFREAEFSLDELSDAAARLLRQQGTRVDDGRVAGAPDARAIRFYQTLGVLDKPLRYDGRRAVYGYRHLLQILAVKRLQAEGYPLGVIQASLPAKSTGDLERGLSSAAPMAGQPRDPDAPPPAPAVSPRRVLTAEIAPGVTVTIDPAHVSEPERLIRRLAAHLASGGPKED